jgi:hypothetical protein
VFLKEKHINYVSIIMNKEMNKRIALIVVFVILLSSFVLAAGQEELFIPRDAVTISLLNHNPDPVEPGNIVELRLRLENKGIQKADNIEVEIFPVFPFTPIGDTIQKFNVVGGRTVGSDGVTIKYKLQVAPDAAQGRHEVRLRHRTRGSNWVLSDSFFVEVQTQDAIILLEDVKTIPSVVGPGDTAQLHITLQNIGDSSLRNIRAKLDLVNTPIAPLFSANEQSVRLIKGKESDTVIFTIAADPDAVVKVHKVPLFLDYVDDQGTVFSFNRSIGVRIEEKPDYLLGVEERTVYRAKEKGNVIVSMANIGLAELKFVSMELMQTPDYEVISSPSVYIGNLESDDFETAEFTIKTNRVKGTIPLRVILRFKDGFNKNKQDIRDIPLKIYSSSDAKRLGLVAPANIGNVLFSLIIFVITSVFWLFMLMDLRKTKMVKYKKLLWFILVIGTHVIGALIYFFLGRRKTLGSA